MNYQLTLGALLNVGYKKEDLSQKGQKSMSISTKDFNVPWFTQLESLSPFKTSLRFQAYFFNVKCSEKGEKALAVHFNLE